MSADPHASTWAPFDAVAVRTPSHLCRVIVSTEPSLPAGWTYAAMSDGYDEDEDEHFQHGTYRWQEGDLQLEVYRKHFEADPEEAADYGDPDEYAELLADRGDGYWKATAFDGKQRRGGGHGYCADAEFLAMLPGLAEWGRKLMEASP